MSVKKCIYLSIFAGLVLGATDATPVAGVITVVVLTLICVMLDYPNIVKQQNEENAAKEAKEAERQEAEARRAAEDRREEEMHQVRLKLLQEGRPPLGLPPTPDVVLE